MARKRLARITALAGLLAAIATCPGCMVSVFAKSYETVVDFKGDSLGSAAVDWDEGTYANALFGWVEASDPIQLYEVCPNGVSYIEYAMSPGDTFLNGITLGLYTPLTVSVYCSEGLALRVELTEDGRASRVVRTGRWRPAAEPG